MSSEKETVITRLSREMKASPLLPPVRQTAERHILADGYERQTAEEPLQTTERYRNRVMRRIIRTVIILILIDLLALAVYRANFAF